ncbi:TetR/AcrR family transcriptional regulator [Microbacterium sp.]|uniref:TetR/AcrR family transcriptional regulator n=1 Tax=Microbacterium sp. TaxID=51671 RepID=UPI0039E5738F
MSAQRRGRPRLPATQQRVLEAAASLIRECGINGLTMTEVARTAGVGKQTLYRRWPSKHALAAQCVLDGILVVDAVVPVATGEVTADLRRWWARSVQALEDPEQAAMYRALTSAAAADPAAAQLLADRLSDPIEAALRQLLRAGIDEGVLRRDCDVAAAARLLVDALASQLARPVPAGNASSVLDIILCGIRAV